MTFSIRAKNNRWDNDPDFEKFYSSYCQLSQGFSSAIKYYKKRFTFKKKLKPVVFIVCIALFFPLADYLMNRCNPLIASLLILLYALVCIVYLTDNSEAKIVERSFKNKILNKALQALGNIIWIQDHSSSIISDDEIYKTDLFVVYDSRKIDDEFIGEYKGGDFRISETELHKRISTGRRTQDLLIFKGVIVTFKYNKIIKNRTIIATKGITTGKSDTLFLVYSLSIGIMVGLIILSQFNNWLQKTIKENLIIVYAITCFISYIICSFIKPKEAFNEVRLEDVKFRRRFNVYSSDQVEARFLITPTFMERFYNIKTTFKARALKCSFYEDKLMIAIYNSSDLFNLPNLTSNTSEKDDLRSFYNQLSSIYKLIEYLQLDSNTYSQSDTSTEYGLDSREIA